MSKKTHSHSVRDLLLARRGVACFAPGDGSCTDAHVRAIELELAEIGYVVSTRLRNRLTTGSPARLKQFCSQTITALLDHLGGNRKHRPLFRKFPEGIPDDTRDLWWKKVLVHYLQSEDQPCLFCGQTGTTHVLSPCRHVVCDQCFDGANYSACPSCEHQVDRSSPFFQELPERELPKETITFSRIDLAEDEATEAQKFFLSLCERKQALSPDDREALAIICKEYTQQVLQWIPETIPVRENVAIVFGSLIQQCDPETIFPIAGQYIKTATDVLRFIAAYSGADPSLQRETVFKTIESVASPSRFWGAIAKMIGARNDRLWQSKMMVPLRVHRFKVAKMSRPLRRGLLGLLEEMEPQSLTEDMLRHRSYWVWIGQFLHPHEYARRFPKVARAFTFVRKKSPDGTVAPHFHSWYSKVEQAFASGDVDKILAILTERPGELARRLDRVLRAADREPHAVSRIVEAFQAHISSYATPLLLTLRSHLSTRHAPAPIRVYWPKGNIAKGVSDEDRRETLPAPAIDSLVEAITSELLHRFEQKPHRNTGLIDEALREIMVPFNERTASASAVQLPRGSKVSVQLGKTARLFLHWCEPEKGGMETDLDLSVGLYDDQWDYVGVCSYYQLKLQDAKHQLIASSAGDLRNGPWPDGATEFVDLHLSTAAAGCRYAVMVVNSYDGMPFSQLERGFAGLMLRDDTSGKHFDPRTVKLRFNLDGENGIYMPFVLDLKQGHLHWLDVQSKGDFRFNNVQTSNQNITKICPELMAYFSSGARPNLYELALLHAAARCRQVTIRSDRNRTCVRGDDETVDAFFRRLICGEGQDQGGTPGTEPVFAALYLSDFDLPAGSDVYALLAEQAGPNLAASDLLS